MNSHFSRTDVEADWPDFLRWIGSSTLEAALQRKNNSLEEWMSFRDIAPALFSTEIGLSKLMKRWKSTRRLWFPKEFAIHDAYSFITSCVQIKKELDQKDKENFRRRVISEILPSGRLCHLQQEFRVAHSLSRADWRISRAGYCGFPGSDFVATRSGSEIEVETKCLSPDVGLGIPYEFAARLLAGVNRKLRSAYPDHLTILRISISGESKIGFDKLRDQMLNSYEDGTDFHSDYLKIGLELRPIAEFIHQFPDSPGWLQSTFQALRKQRGDYGYFIRRDQEIIFCNLIPLRPNLQVKKVLRLISNVSERQFTKKRPALLWLHLQGLRPEGMSVHIKEASPLFRRLAGHAFRSARRDHLLSLVLSSDEELEHTFVRVQGREVRTSLASGKVEGFDNPFCRYKQSPVFAPLPSSRRANSILDNNFHL